MKKKNDNREQEERQRLDAVLSLLAPRQRDVLAPVADNLAWMKPQLEDMRQELIESGIITEYNNGGGQQGTRQNPTYRAYMDLYKAYLSGASKILEAVQRCEVAQVPQENVKNLTVLDQVRIRKGNA